jgi:hypothetical protein
VGIGKVLIARRCPKVFRTAAFTRTYISFDTGFPKDRFAASDVVSRTSEDVARGTPDAIRSFRAPLAGLSRSDILRREMSKPHPFQERLESGILPHRIELDCGRDQNQ